MKTLIETNGRASPTVAGHIYLYSLGIYTHKEEDEDGQQQLSTRAEPRTTMARIKDSSSSIVTSPNVVQRDDARC